MVQKRLCLFEAPMALRTPSGFTDRLQKGKPAGFLFGVCPKGQTLFLSGNPRRFPKGTDEDFPHVQSDLEDPLGAFRELR